MVAGAGRAIRKGKATVIRVVKPEGAIRLGASTPGTQTTQPGSVSLHRGCRWVRRLIPWGGGGRSTKPFALAGEAQNHPEMSDGVGLEEEFTRLVGNDHA